MNAQVLNLHSMAQDPEACNAGKMDLNGFKDLATAPTAMKKCSRKEVHQSKEKTQYVFELTVTLPETTKGAAH